MESRIRIKTSKPNMVALFDMPEIVNVRYYDLQPNNIYKAVIRHKELDKPITGQFSATSLVKRLTAENCIDDTNITDTISEFIDTIENDINTKTQLLEPYTHVKLNKQTEAEIAAICDGFKQKLTELLFSNRKE